MTLVSIHAPRAGCDTTPARYLSTNSLFQFTHPVRGATCVSGSSLVGEEVSIHAPRAGCDIKILGYINSHLVSIHAPRAGCDSQTASTRKSLMRFNSRTPCGVRQYFGLATANGDKFQFTHPVRGATIIVLCCCMIGSCFNSRTPCGVRLSYHNDMVPKTQVSIHAPRAGCDLNCLV